MGQTNLPRHCKTQAHASLFFRVERLTQPRQRRCAETQTFVLHDHRQPCARIEQTNGDPAAGRHRLDRIAQQVSKDLLDPVTVSA